MKWAHCLLFILAVAFSPASAETSDAKVTPVEKVLELLHGMLEKAKKEKHEEMMQFAAFKQFCDDTIAKKKEEIAAAEEKIEQLVAEMEKLEAYILQLGKDIKKLLEDIATWEAGGQRRHTI